MGETISTSQPTGVLLTAADNPLTIAQNVRIIAFPATGVYGNASQSWTVTNYGTVDGYNFGVKLADGGSVTNAGTASSIANDARSGDGVYIGGGAGTVSNAGFIGGLVDAIKFVGSFADRVILDPGATLIGAVQGGSGTNTLELAGAGGTLSAFYGQFESFGTVTVDSGASWDLAATNTIGAGVTLTDSGTLTNAGYISSTVTMTSGAGTFTNSGSISGGANFGVFDSSSGAVTNSGTITGFDAVALGGGSVANIGSASRIVGDASVGVGVDIGGSAGTVTNAGTITAYDAVVLGGGRVTNSGATSDIAASGGNGIGVYINGGAGTVTDAGTIGGADAIRFNGSFADRVILDPGATLIGSVVGGAGTNTLELAAGGAGTLTSFAGQFENFGTVTVDSGASWDLAATTTIGAGVSVTDSGTLTNAGSIGDTVSLTASAGTLTNSGKINGGAGYGVYRMTGAGAVTNSGTISGSWGVLLNDGGSVANNGTASDIVGKASSNIGVDIEGAAGTVTNSGTISGSWGVSLNHGGSVTNSGAASDIVGNANSGIGVYIGGGAGTVTDAGTISGGNAIDFVGAFADRVILDPGARLIGPAFGGSGTNTLELAAGASTGTLVAFNGQFYGFGTVTVDSGATWDLAATTTIGAGVTVTDSGALTNAGSIGDTVNLTSGAGTLTNSGAIGGGAGYGVYQIAGAGAVTNSGTISGSWGVLLNDGGSVANSGAASDIVGKASFGIGVYIGGGAGTVTNAGAITGYDAVVLHAGGSVANSGTASDIGGIGIGVDIGGAVGTVTNAGTITGIDSVILGAGGSVANIGAASDIASASGAGVYIAGGAGTVTDAGTISGGDAIDFAGSFADRVILDPGATLIGAVFGGSGTNTLELAAGASTGTLSAFSQFVSFGTVTVDSGASWDLAATNTIGAGVTLTDSGTLTNAGSIGVLVTVTSGAGTLTNSGTIEGANRGVLLTAGGSVTNLGAASFIDGVSAAGVYSHGGPGTVTNAGTIEGGAYAITFVGSFANRVILDPGATLIGKVHGGSGTNTLELATGGVGTLTSFAGQFENFGTVTVDSGASWDLATTTTIGAGVSVTDSGTLTNAGSIGDTLTLTTSAGTLTNSGAISGGAGYGVHQIAGAGAVTNTGTISGSLGVLLNDGGSVANSGAASDIVGKASIGFGVYIAGGAGTVTNAGAITGYDAVVLSAGGSVTNSGAASDIVGNVSTGIGVSIGGGAGTVTDAGTISGANAIEFSGSFADRVILDPGATLIGTVFGGAGTNTLELAGGGSPGTLSGFSTQFENFGTIQVDPSAQWTLAGSGETLSTGIVDSGTLTIDETGATKLTGAIGGVGAVVVEGAAVTLSGANTFTGGATISDGTLIDASASGASDGPITFAGATLSDLQIDFHAQPSSGGLFADTLTDFGANDQLDLQGLVYTGSGSATLLSVSGDTLSVTEDGATENFTLGGTEAANYYAQSDGEGGTLIETVCFASGTRIRVARGEAFDDVAVEALEVGDLAVTASGALRPIRWIGRRTMDPRQHPHPTQAWPVRVCAHAFGDNLPARDLWLSPAHALCLDVDGEALVPVHALVNGSTVCQVEVETVTYWHVELDSHDILIAENLPAESYLDVGNRRFFGEGGVVALHGSPDAAFTPADFCRPFHAEGAVVAEVRARLHARALELGWSVSDGVEAHLEVDGRRLEPVVRGATLRFHIPAGGREVWLACATARPSEMLGAGDSRDLGLCLGSLWIEDGFAPPRDIRLDDPLLGVGLHELEDGVRRWTAGRAQLPAALWQGCDDGFYLRIDLAGSPLPRWTAPLRARLHRVA